MSTTHILFRSFAAALLALGIGAGSSAAADEPTSAGAANGHRSAAADLWLQATLFTTYTLNDYLNPYCIGVEVQDGVVTLRGEVKESAEKTLALRLAEQVDGVRIIDDRISIGGTAVDDSYESDLHRAMRTANTSAAVELGLARDEHTSGLDIAVDTADSVVTLSGLVHTDAQKEVAGQIARASRDVRSVVNHLTVSKPASRERAAP